MTRTPADDPNRFHTRRRLLALGGAVGITALAGCSLESSDDDDAPTDDADDGDDADDHPDDTGDDADDGDDEPEDDVLTIATYDSFIDAPSSSPGPWLAETFADEYDIEIEWATPSNGINHYIEQHNAGVDVDADMFVGLNVDDLITIDDNIDDELFSHAAVEEIDGVDDIIDGLWFDPGERTIPYATNYISLVYDGTAIDAPETFEGLLDPEFSGDLITQNPADSTTGLAFFLHTVHQYGEDDFLEYWEALQDNDVRVLGSWDDAYAAWSGGEAPMVVSYSTDQVFANMEDADLEQHQIRFLENEAYANPEGAAIFSNAENPELAATFLEFLLSPRVQGEIAQLNVQFPATETADLPDDYDELAHEPDVSVTFTYEELQGSLDQWVDDWSRQFASN